MVGTFVTLINFQQDAMTGKGVDRHLFCLYVVSKYLELDSPFLKASYRIEFHRPLVTRTNDE